MSPGVAPSIPAFFCFIFLGFLNFLSLSSHFPLLGDTSFHFQQISCQFLLTSLSFSAHFLSVPVHFHFIFNPFHPRFWSFPCNVWLMLLDFLFFIFFSWSFHFPSFSFQVFLHFFVWRCVLSFSAHFLSHSFCFLTCLVFQVVVLVSLSFVRRGLRHLFRFFSVSLLHFFWVFIAVFHCQKSYKICVSPARETDFLT